MIKRLLSSFLILGLYLSISSCEKASLFQSESKVKEKLEGTWDLIPIPRTNPDEIWTFNNGNLIRKKAPAYGAEPAPYDTAQYTVNTSATRIELKIEDFRMILDELNGTWQIVRLDDEFLVMATDHNGASGILQREFQKRK